MHLPETSKVEGKIDNLELEELVLKAAGGDGEALEELCTRILGDVLFRARRILGNGSDAEDVTQEALLRVCERLHQLKEPKAFRKWLSCIVVNEARQHMKRNSKMGELIDVFDEIETTPEENTDFLPEAFVEKEEGRSAVLTAVDNLPPKQRQAVVLHYFDGLNVSETARAMNVATPHASRYLSKARSNIKKELEKQSFMVEGRAYGFSLLPIGTVLANVFGIECNAFTPANRVWVQDTLEKCGEIVFGTGGTVTASAVAAGTAGLTTAAVVKTCAIAATVVVATTTITVATIVSTPVTEEYDEYTQALVGGEIVFTGYDHTTALVYVNPERAEVLHLHDDQGTITVLEWTINPLYDEEEIILRGEGGVVEEVFSQMLNDGKYGEYMLFFLLEMPNGDIYRLGHNFIISGHSP